MADDDDWDLTPEELDRLEQEALRASQQQKLARAEPSPDQSVGGASVSWRQNNQASCAGAVRSSISQEHRPDVLRQHVSGAARAFCVSVRRRGDGFLTTHSPYNKDLVSSVKTVPGSLWDKSARCWVFPPQHLGLLLDAIQRVPCLDAQIDLEPSLAGPETERHMARMEPCPQATLDPMRQGGEACQPVLGRCTTGASWPGPAPADHNDMTCGSEDVGRQFDDGTEGAGFAGQSSDSAQEYNVPSESRSVKLLPAEKGRIMAKFRFHHGIADAVKKVKGAMWDPARRVWTLPASSLEELKSSLASVPRVSVFVDELPNMAVRALVDCGSLSDDSERFEQLPSHFREALMPFQEEGIRAGLRWGGRILVADEMGLGKTIQALGLAGCYIDEWPALVIVPSALRLHWAISIHRWLHIPPNEITVMVAAGSSSGHNRDGFNMVRCARDQSMVLEGAFNVVSYELIDRVANHFEVVIADESHYLKNYKAKRTTLCIPRLQKAKRAVLLTGTPALARPIDLFKQLEALQPRVYKSMKEFGSRYCRGGIFGEYTGSSNLDELHSVLSATVMKRRLKKDVLPQLPPKRREQVVLMLSDKSMEPIRVINKQLEHAKKAVRASMEEDDEKAGNQARHLERELISKLYSKTAEAKAPAVKEYVSTLLESGYKFLIFAHHFSMMDAVEDHLKSHASRPAYIRIDGRTPAGQRQSLVDAFQTVPTIVAAVLAIQAAGVGITLTEASTVVFAELSWNPGDIVQAEDRAHRIGQASSVNVFYLHAPETADDLIWSTLEHKLENLGQALDGRDKSQNSLAVDGRVKPRHSKQQLPTHRGEPAAAEHDVTRQMRLTDMARVSVKPAAEHAVKHHDHAKNRLRGASCGMGVPGTEETCQGPQMLPGLHVESHAASMDGLPLGTEERELIHAQAQARIDIVCESDSAAMSTWGRTGKRQRVGHQ